MFLTELLFAFVVAMILSLIFVPLMAYPRGAGDGSSVLAGVLFFFVIVMFATWAGGLWFTPVGPQLWGVSWLPFVFVGLVVGLLLLAAAEPVRRRRLSTQAERAERADAEMTTMAVFGVLFWVLMVALMVAVVARYTVIG